MALKHNTVLALLAVLAGHGGCGQGMDDQPKLEAQEAAPAFPHGQAARPLPEGVVPRGAQPAAIAAEGRYRLERIRRGRQRYDIYCAPCHGRLGDGHGMVARRGFPNVPSLLRADVAGTADRELYRVITVGTGTMYGHGGWIPPADRWNIVAYLRALQLSRDVALDDLGPGLAERARRELP